MDILLSKRNSQSKGAVRLLVAIILVCSLGYSDLSYVGVFAISLASAQQGANPQVAEFLAKGKNYNEKNDSAAALGAFEKAETLLEQLVKDDPNETVWKDQLARIQAILGDQHIKLGNTDKALEAFQKGRDILRELLDSNPNNAQFKTGLSVFDKKIDELGGG